MIANEDVGADHSPVTVDDIWVALARVGHVDRAHALADRLRVAPGDFAALGAKAVVAGVQGGLIRCLAGTHAAFRATTTASHTRPDGAE